jgi:probable HAF family extracellular repeat protein
MATPYTIHPLLSLGPYISDSHVFGLNENGAAAGIGYRGVLLPSGQISPAMAGAIWNGGYPAFSLPIDSHSVLYELNDGGVAFGLRGFDNSPTEVAIVIKGGAVIPLDNLVGQGSLATDINNAGLVCGSVFFGTGDNRAFIYDSNTHTVPVRIDPLPGGTSSGANAINDAGDVVGKSANRGYFWRQGGMTDLGPAAFIEDVNKDSVVCGSVGAAPPTNFVAGVWNAKQPTPAFTPIALPQGFAGAHAQGINDDGAVVGTCWTGQTYNAEQTAYLSHQGVGVDLNTLIAPGSGWHLESATDINNRGQIVGYGTWNGVYPQGFLLSPPPLSSNVPDLVALFILGAVIFGGGGSVFLPGGPRPVDPSGPPMWLNLSVHKRDTLIALALDEAARSLGNMNARASIRRAALEAARVGIEALIQAEELTDRLSALPRLAPRRLESGKLAADLQRHK